MSNTQSYMINEIWYYSVSDKSDYWFGEYDGTLYQPGGIPMAIQYGNNINHTYCKFCYAVHLFQWGTYNQQH